MISNPAPEGTPNSTLWNNIPQEMRERPQWCFCSLRIKDNGKKDKRPLDPKAPAEWFVFAAVDEPRSWGTFEQARDAAIKVGGGIGYVLTEDDPFAIIDVDPLGKEGDMRPPEEIRPMQELLNLHRETYRELSQSGLGAHIIVKSHNGGPIGLPGVNRHGIEAYSQERFVICTGNVDYFGGAKALGTAAGYHRLVEVMVAKGFRTDIAGALEPCGPAKVTNEAALAWMFARSYEVSGAKRGDELRRWHEQGTGVGENRSEVDQSYLNSAVNACKGNWEQALDLFRSSALWRGIDSAAPKYRKESQYRNYLEITVKKSVDSYALRMKEFARKRKLDTERGRELAQRLNLTPQDLSKLMRSNPQGKVK